MLGAAALLQQALRKLKDMCQPKAAYQQPQLHMLSTMCHTVSIPNYHTHALCVQHSLMKE